MEKLKLILDDIVLIGRHGDFGKAVDPLEDELEKIMIAVDSGLEDCTGVDLDGDLEIESIYGLQDNTTEQEVRDFVIANIQQVVDKVRDEIAYKISGD